MHQLYPVSRSTSCWLPKQTISVHDIQGVCLLVSQSVIGEVRKSSMSVCQCVQSLGHQRNAFDYHIILIRCTQVKINVPQGRIILRDQQYKRCTMTMHASTGNECDKSDQQIHNTPFKFARSLKACLVTVRVCIGDHHAPNPHIKESGNDPGGWIILLPILNQYMHSAGVAREPTLIAYKNNIQNITKSVPGSLLDMCLTYWTTVHQYLSTVQTKTIGMGRPVGRLGTKSAHG